MRDTNPVWQDPKTGVWNVFRYQDVAAVLADYRTFSSDLSQVFPDMAKFAEGNLISTDPPYHHHLRHLVSQAFTPRTIARLEAHIEELTEELLDQAQGRTQIELVGDLAYPLPVTVIAELLGVPPTADPSRFRTGAEFHDYICDHVGQRRIEPRQDLLSGLVAAEIDGQRLSDQEIVGFAALLLHAGHITTTALLGNAILCLDEHPQAQDALRDDSAAIPRAIEEVLRYRSPVARIERVTTAEVQLGEQMIAPRKMLNIWLLSANHDEREFEKPDDFVIDRHPNPHVGFGTGIHYCLGAPLARLESKIALGILLRRFSQLRVDPERPLEPYPAAFGINAVRRLHLLAEPA
jgi:cytochrome P450